MTGPITLTPIGVVRGGRSEIFEDHWGPVISRLVLDPAAVGPDAALGLSEFSHIEVVFHFHRETRTRHGAAHPRGNPAWPRVGVLGAAARTAAPAITPARGRGSRLPRHHRLGTSAQSGAARW